MSAATIGFVLFGMFLALFSGIGGWICGYIIGYRDCRLDHKGAKSAGSGHNDSTGANDGR